MLARPVAAAITKRAAKVAVCAPAPAAGPSSSASSSSSSPYFTSSSSHAPPPSRPRRLTVASAVPATSIPSVAYQSSPSSARSLHTTQRRTSAWPAGASATDDVEDASPATTSSFISPDDVTVHISAGSGTQERRPSRLSQSGAIDRTDAGSSKTRSRLEMPKSKPAKTLLQLKSMKKQGIPIACLTAYDYPSALSLRHSDIDVCLVGDSLANVALGHASTQQLTLDATIHHCQAVHRGLFSPVLSVASHTPGAPLLIADVPFGAFQASEDEGVRSAIRILKEGGADGVKIEGGFEILPLVRRLTQFGIPVMGHLGLQPQRVGSSAGYRLQGRTSSEAFNILREALALQEAGVFSIVLECIPNKVGEIISSKLEVPTIGIGAGPKTDGQILVTNDMLGELTSPWHVIMGLEKDSGSTQAAEHDERQHARTSQTIPLPQLHPSAPAGPKFVRNFVSSLASPSPAPSSSSAPPPSSSSPRGAYGLGALRLAAVEAYVDAVRQRTFPDEDKEGYKIKGDELRGFLELCKEAGL